MHSGKLEAPYSSVDPNAELEQLASQLDEPVEPYIRKHRKRRGPAPRSDNEPAAGGGGKRHKAHMSDEQLNLLRLKINSRERRRMHDLNSAMEALRVAMLLVDGEGKMPGRVGGSRKLSKISTLMLAKTYIESMVKTIGELQTLCNQAGRSDEAKAIVDVMVQDQTSELNRRASSEGTVTPQAVSRPPAITACRPSAGGQASSGSSADDSHNSTSRRSSSTGSERDNDADSRRQPAPASAHPMSVSRLLAHHDTPTRPVAVPATTQAAPRLAAPMVGGATACFKAYLGPGAPCACDRCTASAWHLALSNLVRAPLYSGMPPAASAAAAIAATAGLLQHRDAGVLSGIIGGK